MLEVVVVLHIRMPSIGQYHECYLLGLVSPGTDPRRSVMAEAFLHFRAGAIGVEPIPASVLILEPGDGGSELVDDSGGNSTDLVRQFALVEQNAHETEQIGCCGEISGVPSDAIEEICQSLMCFAPDDVLPSL